MLWQARKEDRLDWCECVEESELRREEAAEDFRRCWCCCWTAVGR